MSYGFLDIATTPSVRSAQAAMGSDHVWQDFKGERKFDKFTPDEAAFIARRDSFYMATVSETGWPYVQHRGRSPGFLKVVDEKTLAFPDYRGNRQHISLGNLNADDRAAVILVDYAHKARLKIFAHIGVTRLDARPDLTAFVDSAGYKAMPERILLLRLAEFDWNCPQHITPQFTEMKIAEALQPLRDRLAALKANAFQRVASVSQFKLDRPRNPITIEES
jgi:uncharacterized protein